VALVARGRAQRENGGRNPSWPAPSLSRKARGKGRRPRLPPAPTASDQRATKFVRRGGAKLVNALVKPLPSPRAWLIDVGASTGGFSIASSGRSHRVYAVEGDRGSSTLVRRTGRVWSGKTNARQLATGSLTGLTGAGHARHIEISSRKVLPSVFCSADARKGRRGVGQAAVRDRKGLVGKGGVVRTPPTIGTVVSRVAAYVCCTAGTSRP